MKAKLYDLTMTGVCFAVVVLDGWWLSGAVLLCLWCLSFSLMLPKAAFPREMFVTSLTMLVFIAVLWAVQDYIGVPYLREDLGLTPRFVGPIMNA